METTWRVLAWLAPVGGSVILGVIASFIVVFFVESKRKPCLKLTAAPPSDQLYKTGYPATVMRALRVRVRNEELPRWLRWMGREPAQDCIGTITFLYLDDRRRLFTDDMPGRWAGSPEPVALRGVVGTAPLLLWDPARLSIISKMNVPAGEQEDLDVVVRLDDESDAYGWNNESYQNAWRNPNWRLDKGRYVLQVTIRSAGQKVSERFLLNNDLDRRQFRLEVLEG